MSGAERRDLSLVFLIDALGHEIVGKGGFLDGMVRGERPVVRTILGYSSGALPSLFTGLPPNRHGHWSMYRRASGKSVFSKYSRLLRLVGRLPRGQWRARRWLARRLRRDGVTGYFSLYEIPLRMLPEFDLCARRNYYLPGGFDGARSLFDHLAQAEIRHRVWDWTVPEERAFDEMREAAAAGKEDFLFLYTGSLDGTMHTHGPASAAARRWLEACEGKITAIVDAARVAGRRTRLRVFGDHGMAPVRRHVDLMSLLELAPVRERRGTMAFLDSTMARFWFESDAARRVLAERLSACEGGRFLSDEEMREHGIDFPDRSYGEMVWLCDPGAVILPSHMGSSPLLGMHGYDPDDPHSHTTLLADPPPDRFPTSILEIAPLLLSELGVRMEVS